MSWYKKYLEVYDKPFDSVAYEAIIAEVCENINRLQSDTPLATISVIAHNEEKHLLACLWSLSELKSVYPIEIVGVDNASTDRTADIYKMCGVRYFYEERKSHGFARQCGLNAARGKYLVCIDADTLYPAQYVNIMVKTLIDGKSGGVVGVNSLWSFFPDENHSRVGLFFYELARDIYLWLQAFKRPTLCVRGMVFAHDTELARRVGIRTDIKRGEDGTLARRLLNYGKIVFVRNRKARAITGYGTIGQSLFGSFKTHVIRIMGDAKGFFVSKNEFKDQESNLLKNQ